MPVRQALCRLCTLVRHEQEVPLQLCTSWMVTVAKRNGKQGLAGWRRLEILDSIGGSWYRGLWQRLRPRFAASHYGFVPGRRREQAVLLARLQLWRVAAMGAFVAASLWDSRNAFPSTRW